MLVARLHAAHELVVRDELPPVAGPGEVLVRVEAVGLCGSDTHWWETGGIGSTPIPPGGLVLGHEIAGTIDGPDGEPVLVAVDPSQPCGSCATCAAGLDDLCPSTRFAGYADTDGGLREVMAWPRDLLVPVPAGVDAVGACQLEALGVAIRAVDRAGVGPGSSVAVIGTGPIGLLIVRLCRWRGATTILASDLLEHRVAAARASGATLAWRAGVGATPPADLPPVDVAIEVAGTDDAVAAAIDLVRPGGHVVLVGIPEGSDRTTFRASTARRKGLTLSLSRRMRATDLQTAAALVGDGTIALDGLVTDVVDLADAPRAFTIQAARSGLKVVVRPQHAIV